MGAADSPLPRPVLLELPGPVRRQLPDLQPPLRLHQAGVRITVAGSAASSCPRPQAIRPRKPSPCARRWACSAGRFPGRRPAKPAGDLHLRPVEAGKALHDSRAAAGGASAGGRAAEGGLARHPRAARPNESPRVAAGDGLGLVHRAVHAAVLFAAVSGVYLFTARKREARVGWVVLGLAPGVSLLFMLTSATCGDRRPSCTT